MLNNNVVFDKLYTNKFISVLSSTIGSSPSWLKSPGKVFNPVLKMATLRANRGD